MIEVFVVVHGMIDDEDPVAVFATQKSAIEFALKLKPKMCEDAKWIESEPAAENVIGQWTTEDGGLCDVLRIYRFEMSDK